MNHWKQLDNAKEHFRTVVICFHFSIFEPLETVLVPLIGNQLLL
ncbi:hypothetical protein HMPREF9446_03716 [Bacteroides fluxus YIT 12057]|uniref:Uncharacterized protein n=1 Tax=Bacteroides fluxus YIT 12057 TaxID=763034 RepID=F3PY68_9BACE|nr:hypothetical protein HMPREF9446_03716 [Bacteroides fluxus YIT 12057]